MTILMPVRELPPRQQGHPISAQRDERRLAYMAAKRAAPWWQPIECDSYREALYLANGARRHSTFQIEAEQRGTVCYLRFIGRRGFEPIHEPSADLQARQTLERINT